MIERLGITIKPTIGIGDALQFSSLPENYYRATGQRLYLVGHQHWFFDYNPFVLRDILPHLKIKTTELWNFGPKQWDFPVPRKDAPAVYTCNAEIGAALFKVPVALNRPRLYRFEDVPFEKRETILFHIEGRSHGTLPKHVIDHVVQKYAPTGRLFTVGPQGLPGVRHFGTPDLWSLAKVISEARMFIGPDSGPSWIAACYPDVVVKKIRTKPTHDVLKDWTPLAIGNVHSHWDDRCHQIFNTSDEDIGFTSSYRKL